MMHFGPRKPFYTSVKGLIFGLKGTEGRMILAIANHKDKFKSLFFFLYYTTTYSHFSVH